MRKTPPVHPFGMTEAGAPDRPIRPQADDPEVGGVGLRPASPPATLVQVLVEEDRADEVISIHPTVPEDIPAALPVDGDILESR